VGNVGLKGGGWRVVCFTEYDAVNSRKIADFSLRNNAFARLFVRKI
jgi:hypothetical protein